MFQALFLSRAFLYISIQIYEYSIVTDSCTVHVHVCTCMCTCTVHGTLAHNCLVMRTPRCTCTVYVIAYTVGILAQCTMYMYCTSTVHLQCGVLELLCFMFLWRCRAHVHTHAAASTTTSFHHTQISQSSATLFRINLHCSFAKHSIINPGLLSASCAWGCPSTVVMRSSRWEGGGERVKARGGRVEGRFFAGTIVSRCRGSISCAHLSNTCTMVV